MTTQLPLPPPGTLVRLIISRHGETALNASHALQGGGVDPPLNDRGTEQSAALGRALVNETIDLVASSAMLRAVQTADAIAATRPGVARATFVDLNEIRWGELEGLVSPNLEPLNRAWLSGNFDYAPPGGESPNQAAERAVARIFAIVNEALAQRAAMPDDRTTPFTVAIVIHGRLLRIVLSSLMHRTLHMMPTINHTNANVNVLDFKHFKPAHRELPLLASLPVDTFLTFSTRHFTMQTAPWLTAVPLMVAAVPGVKESKARVWAHEGEVTLTCVWGADDVADQLRRTNTSAGAAVDDAPPDLLLVATVICGISHLESLF
ncbi:histidine phosphatase superfamily [Blastocladiella britannica]|nr:histidine phosphatase superfamily [Blastocladiella britannica]